MQNVGLLRVKRAGAQIILTDEIAHGKHAAVNIIHHGIAGGLAVQMRQTALAAKHMTYGTALGQVATLGHNQIGRRQLQRKGKLHLLVPWVIRRGNAHTALHKYHRPITAVAVGAGNIEHFGVLPVCRSAAGSIIGDAGAQ